MKKAADKADLLMEVIAAKAGTITCSNGAPEPVNRAAPNAASVLYDAVVVLGGASAKALSASGLAINFVSEAFRHGKPIAALGDGAKLLKAAGLGGADAKTGVFQDGSAGTLDDFIAAMKQPRFHDRDIDRP